MDFSIVDSGYDREEVESCLLDLGEQLARASAQAESAARMRVELGMVRAEAERLHEMLRNRPAVYRNTLRIQQMVTLAEEEAADILAEARDVLAKAREDAQRIRADAYNDAVKARRDFELALADRRRREDAAGEVLSHIKISFEPAGAVGGPAVPGAAPARGVASSAGAVKGAAAARDGVVAGAGSSQGAAAGSASGAAVAGKGSVVAGKGSAVAGSSGCRTTDAPCTPRPCRGRRCR